MFLKRIPNDSKIIITFITGALFGGIGLGVRKLMYDPTVIVNRSKSPKTFDKQSLRNWEEIISNVV